MDLPPKLPNPPIISREIKNSNQISFDPSPYCIKPEQLRGFTKEIMEKGKPINIRQLEEIRDAKNNRHKSFIDEIMMLQSLNFSYYAYKINSSVQGELYAVVGMRTDKENKQTLWLAIFDPKEKETVYRSYADEGREVNVTKLIFRMVTGDSEVCKYRFGTISSIQNRVRLGAMPEEIPNPTAYFKPNNP